MPNGGDKNWVRLCAVIDGYRARYGVWPARIRMWSVIINDLRDHILTPESFAYLESKIDLVEEGVGMIAEGEDDESYDYAAEGFTKIAPDIKTQDWLGIEPRPDCY